MTCRKLLIIFWSFFTAGAGAQTLSENGFAQYTTEKGLSHNWVTGITQDATGYIWVTTASGLNRFDGRNFVQYHSGSDSLSLASETLGGLTWLDKNRFGVYTSGLHIVNTKSGASHNLFVPYKRQQYQYKFNM